MFSSGQSKPTRLHVALMGVRARLAREPRGHTDESKTVTWRKWFKIWNSKPEKTQVSPGKNDCYFLPWHMPNSVYLFFKLTMNQLDDVKRYSISLWTPPFCSPYISVHVIVEHLSYEKQKIRSKKKQNYVENMQSNWTLKYLWTNDRYKNLKSTWAFFLECSLSTNINSVTLKIISSLQI